MDNHSNLDAESLMLDAKKAILEEQHRRFQELQAAGMWPEAMQQLQVTLGCAADLLKDSVNLLESAVARRKQQSPPSQNLLPPPEDDQAK
ncbi:hypothetical protein [Candidatus Nitronereus thalassa]|uniref:Uncharacterized protein n=1 Tax=Candidatus Nitronereus thalassa TaxID=3020898 RepID=A0ABU3K3Q6_9BACT|nr:hypothetical protein [Candidatus Nitronereus thalassa]MDT7041020.1 hypothetical protein [Candidatus Nitronereus thalassa]